MRPRSPRRTLLTLVVALLLAAVATGCGGGASGTGDKGYIDGTGVVTRLAVDERKTPGKVSGTTLDGEELSLSDYAGKVVVLNVWGSWCPPCRKEARSVVAAAAELEKDDVAFVGINTRDSSEEQGLAYERRYGVTYPSLFDPAGRNLLAFAGTLNPSAIPSTVVLDSRGRVAASILGEVPSTRTLVDLVRDVQTS